jgi:hypothetical protein
MAAPHTVRRAAAGGFEILDADGTVVDRDSSMERAVEVAYELDRGLEPVSATAPPADAS